MPSKIPHYRERLTLQAIITGAPFPVGRLVLANLLTKGWVKPIFAEPGKLYIQATDAGRRALRLKIPSNR
jgi:hypothetical protein